MADPVTFDYATWVERYPRFASLSPSLAQLYFNEATILHDNSTYNQIINDTAQAAALGTLTIQATLLNMLTAHIATLNAPDQPLAGASLAGPINHAAEGSVSVGIKTLDAPGSQAWLVQTPPGSEYWYATAIYRTMRYRVGPRRVFNPPLYPYGTWNGGWGRW